MIRFALASLFIIVVCTRESHAQRGYHDAPYVRYEADQGTLNNAAPTPASFAQEDLQSEASDQVCVNMSNPGASVAWTVTEAGDGLVVRYSVPDGQSAVLEVYANGAFAGTMNLGTHYSWQYLSTDPNPNNGGVVNPNPKMRFDEVRMRLPSVIPAGGTLQLVRQSGNVHLDFAELEPVPPPVPSAPGDVVFPGGDLQAFINNNGCNTIYLPAGYYERNGRFNFDANNTRLKGAGSWYTQIHFTSGTTNNGGLWGRAFNISYSGLYLTTVRNSRSNSYKAINGVYTGGSVITDVWAEHFECGAWIGQYEIGPANADGFVMSHCRFRNNYADGINLCRGTRNAVVEHCNFRNNGDDDMAIWSADGMECRDNTFRYNTSENCWRSAGCAIYGGRNNRAHNLLIKDNLEVGIKVNNNFPGVGFIDEGMHEFSDITIIKCGTHRDLFDRRVGAIDMTASSVAGTWVRNVRFFCIDIIDSKNDALNIRRTGGGGGFSNLVFQHISVDGTGREYPDNGGTGAQRGFGVLFTGSPGGSGTYCDMTYENQGGNAPSWVSGAFNWSAAGSCPGGCVPPTTSTTTITSAQTFGVCDNPIALTATTSPPSGATTDYIEFFVDGVKAGEDHTAPYTVNWYDAGPGTYAVTAVAHYAPSGSTASPVQEVTVADGIYETNTPPVIDGVIDPLWANYAPHSLDIVSQGAIDGPEDLSAVFRTTRDATHLHLLVEVTDDILVHDDGLLNWQNDGVELFIDMGNDKNMAYGASDFSYQFLYDDPAVYETQHGATAGVGFEQAVTADGYLMEISIPWATLGGAPADGDFMGFDLHVNDNDGGGDRDAKIAWYDETDNAWQNPSVFGTLQIAACENPMPVELLTFTGERVNGVVVLNWSTATETDNDRFVIERSPNAADWIAIGEVGGAGHSESVVAYSFSDDDPLQGTGYYRLRQVDFDGTYTHSHLVAVKKEGTSSVHLYPNPFEDALTIRGNLSGTIEVTIRDMAGQTRYHTKQRSNEGVLHIRPDIVPGAYVITVQTETTLYHQVIIRK